MIAGESVAVSEGIEMQVIADIMAEAKAIVKEVAKKQEKGEEEVKKQRTGRPTKFRKEMVKDAKKLSSIFCPSYQDFANFWEVDKATVQRWARKHKDFRTAIERGKSVAKRKLHQTMYDLACSGNLGALIFTLTNKFGDEWSDKRALVNNKIVTGVQITENNPGEVRKHVDSLDKAGRERLIKIVNRVEGEVKREEEAEKTGGQDESQG